MSKILIFGFPHCGTSILKSIIGHIDDVDEIIQETDIITKSITNKYILCKSPYTLDKFFTDKYNDYIKIFIIRNPLYVFSSLNKRFNYKIPERVSINKYIESIKRFCYYKNNPSTNLYTITYEDMFDNNYQHLKKILNNIGFKYTDKIFDNTKYENKIIPNTKLLDEKPKNIEHAEYRTWQINQSFVSNNDSSKLDISDKQKFKLLNDINILTIYPDIV